MKIPLTNLRAFESAARLLSFTLAAEELNLTQSAISQQIKQLEVFLEIKVFRRLTRRLELTESGERFYETVCRCLADIDRVVDEIRDENTRGNVVISIGSTFATNWLVPKLHSLKTECPELDVSIKLSDELVDLRSEPSIDLAVRFAQPKRRNFVTRNLGAEQVFVVCSPSLFEGRVKPRTPADLAFFPLLHNEASDREKGGAGNWANWLAELGMEAALDVSKGPRIPRSDLLMQAAVYGQGMALVWETMVSKELGEGKLVKAFEGRFETSNSYNVFCTREAYAKPKVRTLFDWLLKQDALMRSSHQVPDPEN